MNDKNLMKMVLLFVWLKNKTFKYVLCVCVDVGHGLMAQFSAIHTTLSQMGKMWQVTLQTFLNESYPLDLLESVSEVPSLKYITQFVQKYNKL